VINKDFNSISELLKAFPDEQSCIEHLEALRWDGCVISPFDAESKVYKCKGNKYRCRNTNKYFNVKTKTLFDNTRVELQKWFITIWIVTSKDKNISYLKLAQEIDVGQKTAWIMLRRLREKIAL
jgi:transposase-like protein